LNVWEISMMAGAEVMHYQGGRNLSLWVSASWRAVPAWEI